MSLGEEGSPGDDGPMDTIEYFRCQNDHQLVTARMIREGKHVGHRLSPASEGSFWEWLLIKLGLIR